MALSYPFFHLFFSFLSLLLNGQFEPLFQIHLSSLYLSGSIPPPLFVVHVAFLSTFFFFFFLFSLVHASKLPLSFSCRCLTGAQHEPITKEGQPPTKRSLKFQLETTLRVAYELSRSSCFLPPHHFSTIQVSSDHHFQ